jgi:hypothetical protein
MDRQNRKCRTGQPELDRQNWTNRTRLAEWGFLDWAVWVRQPGQDCQKRTERRGQPEKDS